MTVFYDILCFRDIVIWNIRKAKCDKQTERYSVQPC